eukprot:NODE_22455_length_707_cov_3.675862.p2 GENE.NODE_22455_length_707_cov_3.675862~~NODE_22455_length_707_cov_3.675862.p2  ORF type:complete len:79 (+),score=15.77 NODE_22455_length_707_cov_3.675862:412-648(+)
MHLTKPSPQAQQDAIVTAPRRDVGVVAAADDVVQPGADEEILDDSAGMTSGARPMCHSALMSSCSVRLAGQTHNLECT